MERLIFHIDVNSAFLSWEAVRRVRQGLPDLREIPACIGGDPKKRTGIVVAKSIPAKKYGIQTGEPWQWLSESARISRLFLVILHFLTDVPKHLRKSVLLMRR